MRRVRLLRRSVRAYRVRHRQPDWEHLLKRDRERWLDALSSGRGGRRVLIATSVGGNLPASTLESLLAVALTVRGAEVHVLLCDSALPACMEASMDWYGEARGFSRRGPARDLCKDCFAPALAMYRALGFPVHRYSENLTAQDFELADRLSSSQALADPGRFRFDGLSLGEHALAGTLRFFARASLDAELYGGPVLRRYFRASLLAALAARRLMQRGRFEAVVLQHGIYIPQGAVAEVARGAGARVVTWNPAYRKQCFIFSHYDTYHHTMMREPTRDWEDMPWSPELESKLLDYLESRRVGTNDWIWFHDKPKRDLRAIARELGVDFSKPWVALLTNVAWDAQVHYSCNVFPNMLEWVLKTVEYFRRRKDLHLLIRAHPAEVRGTLPSRQRVCDEVRKAFPRLSGNVSLIPPESLICTYTLAERCNAVLIYGTKTGVELAGRGIPVVVAGPAWIRNKGLTSDAKSVGHYFELLDRLPFERRLEGALLERARKYAFHFFFRRMIPLEMVRPAAGWPPYRVHLKGLDEYLPGSGEGLDLICEGILKGTPFIYPAERRSRGTKEAARDRLP